MNAKKAREARRIARAVILSRRWIPMYGQIPLRLIADPAWREVHIFAPREREIRREWDRCGIPPTRRGNT